MNPTDVFRRIVLHLDRRSIAYMMVGSFAGTYFGLSRSTYAIDIVLEAAPDQLKGLIADLQADNYYAELDAALDALKHESLFNVIDNETGWKIDLIFRKSRSFDQAPPSIREAFPYSVACRQRRRRHRLQTRMGQAWRVPEANRGRCQSPERPVE